MENHSAEMTSLGETNVNLDDVIESLYPNGYVTRSILYPGTSRMGELLNSFWVNMKMSTWSVVGLMEKRTASVCYLSKENFISSVLS